MGPVEDHGAGHRQCRWWLSDSGVRRGWMAQVLIVTELQRWLARRCKGHGRRSGILREEREEAEQVLAVKLRAGDMNRLEEQELHSQLLLALVALKKD